MTKTNPHGKNSMFCACATVCILILVVGFIMLTEKLENDTFKKENCTVVDVRYPHNYSVDSLWGECRCGRKCQAYSPKISVYVTLAENATRYILNENNKKEFSYTFFNTSCPEGNKPSSIATALENAQYYNNQYRNRTLTCYFNGEYPILEHYTSITMEYLYVLIGIFGFMICIVCCYYKKLCSISS